MPTYPVEGIDDLICNIDVESVDVDGAAVSYDFAWEIDGASYTGVTQTTYYSGDTIPAALTVSDVDVDDLYDFLIGEPRNNELGLFLGCAWLFFSKIS